MNNWAVKLESQNITFEYIPGIRNTYFPFEELPPVTTQVIEEVIECEIGNINIQHTYPVEVNMDIHLPLKDEKLVKLQESDPHIKQLRKQWEK